MDVLHGGATLLTVVAGGIAVFFIGASIYIKRNQMKGN